MGTRRRWRTLFLSLLFMPTIVSAADVTVRFDTSSPDIGPFPADVFTVPDPAQKTGLRVNLPLPPCGGQPSACRDLEAINQLDGFNLQPRIHVRFSGLVNTETLGDGIFLVWLENLTNEEPGLKPAGHVTGINEVVFDPRTNTVYAEPNEMLDQHRRYALVVTDAVRDAAGDPVEPDPVFSSCVAFSFLNYCSQVADAMARAQVPGRIVGASVFTTMSATAWLEKARAAIQISPVQLARAAPKHTFRFAELLSFTLRFHVGTDPPEFEDFVVTQPLLGLLFVNADRISFGSFFSPRFLDENQRIPAVPTGSEVNLPADATEVFFHVIFPRSPKPAAGYPVVIFGHGLNDSRFGGPSRVADTLAKNGFATVAINAVGHGSGPETTVRLRELTGTTVLPAGGRSIDRNGDGIIESREGCLLLADEPFALRDCLRQTALDLGQLARLIRSGLDADGDGSVDLDPGRIYYGGQSLGALYGALFTSIEPDVRAATLNVGGATVVDIARWSPAFRSLARDFLAFRTPSLLNAVNDYIEDYVLRNQPVKITVLDGAIEIQNVFELAEWLQMPGDPLAYAPHLRSSPLPGVPPKQVLWQFARGDRTVPNPASSNLIRAAGMRESSRLYRHDIARAIFPGLPENPHTYLVDFLDPASLAIAQAAQEQMAGFFATDGATIPDANALLGPLAQRLFETPAVLPETLGFGPDVVNVNGASFAPVVAPGSIATASDSNLAADTAIAATSPLPPVLAGVRLEITDSAGSLHAASLYFVSPSQINYVVPPGVATGVATLSIVRDGSVFSGGIIHVETVAPGLFSANANGAGVAAAVAVRVAADGSQSFDLIFDCSQGPGQCVAKPVDLGPESDQVFLLLFGTGIRNSRSGASVKIGGLDVPVTFAGAQPQFEGLDQVNAGPLPRALAGRGNVSIEMAVDGKPANVLTVSIR